MKFYDKNHIELTAGQKAKLDWYNDKPEFTEGFIYKNQDGELRFRIPAPENKAVFYQDGPLTAYNGKLTVL